MWLSMQRSQDKTETVKGYSEGKKLIGLNHNMLFKRKGNIIDLSLNTERVNHRSSVNMDRSEQIHIIVC